MLTSPKNLLIVFLLLWSAGTGVFAWRQYDLAHRPTIASAADNTDLLAKLAESRRHAADLEARLAALQAMTTANEPASTDNPPAASPERRPLDRPGPDDNRRAERTALFNNPEVMKLMAAQQRTQLDARYAALFKQLKLSPAQIDTLKNLLLEKQSAQRDVMMAARESGMNPRESRDELRKLVEQSNAETDASILSVLGQEKFEQYKTYETTGNQRALVEQIGRSLSYSSAPLTETQSQALVQILARKTNTPPSEGAPADRVYRSVTITDAMIAESRRILSPEQVRALQEQQASQQASAKLQELMRGAGRNRNGP